MYCSLVLDLGRHTEYRIVAQPLDRLQAIALCIGADMTILSDDDELGRLIGLGRPASPGRS